jgi:hypothetical protein
MTQEQEQGIKNANDFLKRPTTLKIKARKSDRFLY